MTSSRTQSTPALRLFRELFSSHSSHVALLDPQGQILAVNDSWMRFGQQNGLKRGYRFESQDYVGICSTATALHSPYAQPALIGLLSVLHASRPGFAMAYPCHSSTQQRWYRMWVESQRPNVPAVIVAHSFLGEKPPESMKKEKARRPTSNDGLLHALASHANPVATTAEWSAGSNWEASPSSIPSNGWSSGLSARAAAWRFRAGHCSEPETAGFHL